MKSEKKLVAAIKERDKVIKDLMVDYRPLHSEFQIDHFIIGSAGPTDWCEYKQCLREIYTRAALMRKYDRESRKLAIKITDATKDGRPKLHTLEAIELEELMESALTTLDMMRDCERELNRFVELAVNLRKGIGKITEEKRVELEERSWMEKVMANVRMDLQVTKTIQPATAHTLSSLPIDMQRRIIAKCTPKKVLPPNNVDAGRMFRMTKAEIDRANGG